MCAFVGYALVRLWSPGTGVVSSREPVPVGAGNLSVLLEQNLVLTTEPPFLQPLLLFKKEE